MTIPEALNLPLSTLVPNHLSTHTSNKNRPPYNILNPQNHQKNTPKIKKPHQKWRGSEKESGGEKEKGEKKGGNEDAEEKKVGRRVGYTLNP